MRVLHLVAGSLSGGAARGAYWLHRAQRELGVGSTLMTNGPNDLDDPSIVSLSSTPVGKIKFALLPRLGKLPARLYREREPNIFNTGFEGVNFTKCDAYKDADIVHLHWINGLASMRRLRKINKPIVWTLRDMWPFTGGCHYSLDCVRYQTGCGRCPQLHSRNSYDLSKLVVFNKNSSVPKQLRVVGISNWLSECAAKSKVFEGFPIQTISNNIDTDQFYPVDSLAAKHLLGLPADKRIILVCAQQINSFYKGFELFLEALRYVQYPGVHVVLVGKVNEKERTLMETGHTALGFLSDTVSLRLAYSAADVFVAPSRMDAFGKTLAESMACGTPVVCFDATGPKDIVEHKQTGYKAKPFSASDLAAGIDWLLRRAPDERDSMRRKSRAHAVTHFASKVIADKYLTLYRELAN